MLKLGDQEDQDVVDSMAMGDTIEKVSIIE
jgi:hypothetical protein